ncbi:hypothetical protein BpHYR1_029951 [Brachionus plicatilis]|uniref:Uncharacterized protein n=1 Tax=Brachionus plicatilis TaxID=10195 RepID=A0A3M7QBP1_BRAPC|nr:hypothetical protein BpHYR1_029951 [Brachionus plicatilis]
MTLIYIQMSIKTLNFLNNLLIEKQEIRMMYYNNLHDYSGYNFVPSPYLLDYATTPLYGHQPYQSLLPYSPSSYNYGLAMTNPGHSTYPRYI